MLRDKRIVLERIIIRGGSISFFVGIYSTVTSKAFAIFSCDPTNWIWSVASSSSNSTSLGWSYTIAAIQAAEAAKLAAKEAATDALGSGNSGNSSSTTTAAASLTVTSSLTDACPFTPGFPFSPYASPNNSANNVYGIIGIVVLILYCVLPFVCIFKYVLKNRSKKHRHLNVLNATSLKYQHALDWIMSPYTVQTRGWEAVILVYKCLFVSMMASSLIQPTGIRFVVLILLLWLSTVLHLVHRPYKTKSMNWIWILFDISHMIGILASTIEYGVDFTVRKTQVFSAVTSGSSGTTSGNIGSTTPSSSASSPPLSSNSLVNGSSGRRALLAATYFNNGGNYRKVNADVDTNTSVVNNIGLSISNEMSFVYLMSIIFCFVW
jgi:hypothetical protein